MRNEVVLHEYIIEQLEITFQSPLYYELPDLVYSVIVIVPNFASSLRFSNVRYLYKYYFPYEIELAFEFCIINELQCSFYGNAYFIIYKLIGKMYSIDL